MASNVRYAILFCDFRGSVVFGAPSTGLLGRLSTIDELRETCPFIFDMTVQRKVGDEVSAMSHNADLIGYVIFDIPENMTYQDCSDAVLGNIDIQIC